MIFLCIVLFGWKLCDNFHWCIHFYLRPVLAAGYCRCLLLSVCPPVCSSVCVIELVHVISFHLFKLGSPNLDQECKRPWFGALLFCGVINLYPQGQIGLDKVKIYPIWACPHDKSPLFEARTTKFEQKMQNTLVKIPIAGLQGKPFKPFLTLFI